MIAPRPVLTFTYEIGSEVARLGDRIVGEILNPFVRPQWRVRLTDWPITAGPAADVAQARRRLASQVSEWLISAGLLDPGCEIAVRVPDREGPYDRHR